MTASFCSSGLRLGFLLGACGIFGVRDLSYGRGSNCIGLANCSLKMEAKSSNIRSVLIISIEGIKLIMITQNYHTFTDVGYMSDKLIYIYNIICIIIFILSSNISI